MVTASMVRQAAQRYHVDARMINGEWRLVPLSAVGTQIEEKVAYYTDCNEDAHFTIHDYYVRCKSQGTTDK